MEGEINNKNNQLAPVLLVNFIGTLGFTIVIPFLVFLVTRLGRNAFLYGLVAAIFILSFNLSVPLS